MDYRILTSTTLGPTKRSSSASFFRRVATVVKNIPRGKVATYGQVAALAGNPRAARQVAWVLNTVSLKQKLPWYRVINHRGKISLSEHNGYHLQRALLIHEGITFDSADRIDLARYQWQPKNRLNSSRKSR
ncbi:MAG: MGMT family protein [Bacteroidota bacterium]